MVIWDKDFRGCKQVSVVGRLSISRKDFKKVFFFGRKERVARPPLIKNQRTGSAWVRLRASAQATSALQTLCSKQERHRNTPPASPRTRDRVEGTEPEYRVTQESLVISRRFIRLCGRLVCQNSLIKQFVISPRV
ncbi:hypothetical protein J5N97_001225 [Dioscorea zingiberensis]|uniref:Uncharacterized protein n=1 Tax=Dioscorea zingiberensis TaxID=325984 RepID=A0A9D5BUN9_9LILI|nr:hypothetical protein J5N97_001225 [Dioscorea zingiberensis]